jgi:hypothetical protein
LAAAEKFSIRIMTPSDVIFPRMSSEAHQSCTRRIEGRLLIVKIKCEPNETQVNLVDAKKAVQ